jgi:hypothetical protein
MAGWQEAFAGVPRAETAALALGYACAWLCCTNAQDTLDVITGLVPVISIREAQRFTKAGWPAQGRPWHGVCDSVQR